MCGDLLRTCARVLFRVVPFALVLVGYSANAGTVQYSYDVLGRVIGVVYADGSSITYAYDSAGNRTQVTHASPTSAFAANPGTITAGGTTTLSWQSSNAVTAVIDNGVGGVTPPTGGTVSVTPSGTTTYTLTLTLPGGALVRGRATVNVVPPPTGTLAANPTSVLPGGSSVLTWSGSGATSASINQGIGSVSPGGGSVTVSPSASTVYTLTLTNAAGTVLTRQTTVSLNHAPIAGNDTTSTNENVAVTFAPLGNDSDPDSDTLAVQSVTTPSHGSTTHTSTAITYTPALNYYGTDSFNYTVSDGRGGTATASVSVTVAFVNQPPVANGDTISCGTTCKPYGVTFDPRANDTDPDGDSITVTAVTNGTYGIVTILNGGTQIKYKARQPLTDVVDYFTYTISDGQGHTATATVEVDYPRCTGKTC